MTDTEAIALRANSATPGPWHVDGPEFGGLWVTAYRDGPSIAGGQPVHPSHAEQRFAVIAGLGEADAEFIAHARTDIPELLARVRELSEVLAFLLDDTQHNDHECQDSDCPVVAARAVLGGTEGYDGDNASLRSTNG